jgi:Abnormal spindle-like microcephaly-assoc'd, ASPM-SPD-2-Hydin/Chitobiase/beta-hexosaminidase C-terminal domain
MFLVGKTVATVADAGGLSPAASDKEGRLDMNRPASRGLRQRLRPLVVFTSLMALATMTFSLPSFVRPAHAALTAVGPIDPADGLPLWYQDPTPMRLKQCFTPGTCATLLPNPALPPDFATNFPSEVFYYRAVSTDLTTGGTGRARLIIATEAAFPNGVVLGQQTLFNRIRIVITGGLVPGATYTVTEPYGVDTLTADAQGAAKFTEDTGCLLPPCPGTVPIGGRVGPWLTWDTFGSTVDAPPPGYIGNFAVPHAVKGSPRGTNFFRIAGPNVGGPGVNTIQTNQFLVSGQLDGPIVTASPAAGTYTTAQSVTLTASDPGAPAGAAPPSIYYTTDGSNPVAPAAGAAPTPPTLLYTGPFALPSTPGTATTTTVKFLGVGASGGISAIQTLTYTIDLTLSPGPVPPTTSVAQLSPANLDFGSVKRPATSAAQRVTLTNTGTAALTIARIAIAGANPGDFAIAATTCGATLAPAASCTVDVTFTPTARHTRSGTLTITDNAAGSPQSVALTGIGL